MKPTRIAFDASRAITVLFVTLIGIELFFVAADVLINVERWVDSRPIRRMFNITREDGMASWFAVTQTWMLGMTGALLAVIVRVQGAPRWRRIGWIILTVFICYMALDDGSKLHERVGSAVKSAMGDDGSEARAEQLFPSYTWQLVFLPLFGAFGLFILWFLNRELTVARDKLYVVAAVGLLVLAVTADFFEGLDMDHPLNLHGWIKETWDLSTYQVRHYSKSVEETMEMMAMSTLWLVFLRHLVRIAPALDVRLRTGPPAQADGG